MRVLVTGHAGFIGFHVASALLARGDFVVGIDNFNDYYDKKWKEIRSSLLSIPTIEGDINDQRKLDKAFLYGIDVVVHLAAQAGVEYSITNPHEYIRSNIAGSLSVIEACKRHNVKSLVYASSSSVYGNNYVPYSILMHPHPMSVYGVSKACVEMLVQAQTFDTLRSVGMRYFTVYGPWGRPDMFMWKATKAILEGSVIKIRGGSTSRSMTFIDDAVAATLSLCDDMRMRRWFGPIQNIGNSVPVQVTHMISLLEKELGIEAKSVEFVDLPPYEPQVTMPRETLVVNGVPIEDGVKKFVKWYMSYCTEG